MPQLRTRKDKERARQVRLKDVVPVKSSEQQTDTYSYSSSQVSKNNFNKSVTSLLKVDQGYILKDLLKTVTISLSLLMVVIGIYFYLRYN